MLFFCEGSPSFLALAGPLLLDPQDIAHLKAMLVMARSRLLYRVRQGAVGIDLPDVEFEISPDRSHVQVCVGVFPHLHLPSL